MALTTAEIQEIKYRMGYGAISVTASPYIDTAPAFETLIQQNVNAFGETEIRTVCLPRLRQLSTDIYNARNRLKAIELVGEVKLNTKEIEKLRDSEKIELDRLCSLTRIPLAPKPGRAGGGAAVVLG